MFSLLASSGFYKIRMNFICLYLSLMVDGREINERTNESVICKVILKNEFMAV